MKASENQIVRLFAIQNTTFTIPVYQRDYNWQEKHCQLLLDDILKVGSNPNENSHFLGSIVYIHDGIYTTGVNEFNIIDGQQRMITLTLLFIALSNFLKNREPMESQRIYKQYVINEYSKEEIKLKVLPPEENLQLLHQIANSEFSKIMEHTDKNIVKNYFFFQEKMNSFSEKEIASLKEGIEKLLYVDIALEKGKDDPQKIFESLNSTGLDLSQADLIRNYILMDLEKEEQNQIYKKVWLVIEQNCKDSDGNKEINYVSNFIRDYLTLKTGKIPTKFKVFEEFKLFYPEKSFEKLEDLKNYSEAYSYIIKPEFEKEKAVSLELKYLKVLDQTVVNTFLIGIIRDYHEGKISTEEMIKILNILQSYLWRRYITGEPSNALNKIFQGMYAKISKGTIYSTVLEEVLLNQNFPSDEELKESLKLKLVYKDKEKLKYVFQKLENYNHNELIDFQNEKITIEHIFPQKPGKAWKDMYSEIELEQMATFRDTISNLTLTGSNSNLGNKSFLEKRDDPVHGFKNSKLFLNKYLGGLSEWNLISMEERFQILYEYILQIWKRPVRKKESDFEKITFVLQGKRASGTGKLLSNNHFEILKGSTFSKKIYDSAKKNHVLIKQLLKDKILEDIGDKYLLKENYKVTSPSAAATLIFGRVSNGWRNWKTYEGKLLGDFRKK